MNLLDLARSALPLDAPIPTVPDDPATVRRRARVLAMLDADPDRRIAVVAEAGNPAHVAVAIRGIAVGQLEIAKDRYDAFTLLALLDEHARH